MSDLIDRSAYFVGVMLGDLSRKVRGFPVRLMGVPPQVAAVLL